MDRTISRIDDTSLPPWERGVRQSGPMDLEAMKENLFEFASVMDSCDIKFLITLGTLVGALREKQFLVHDNDADVMCLWPDYPKMYRVIENMKKRGFHVPEGCPIHDTNFIRHGEKIEVWWFGHVGNQLIYQPRFTLPNPKWYYETTPIQFLGREFLAPKDYDGFLRYVYRDDWRVPSKARWCGSADKLVDNNY